MPSYTAVDEPQCKVIIRMQPIGQCDSVEKFSRDRSWRVAENRHLVGYSRLYIGPVAHRILFLVLGPVCYIHMSCVCVCVCVCALHYIALLAD